MEETTAGKRTQMSNSVYKPKKAYRRYGGDIIDANAKDSASRKVTAKDNLKAMSQTIGYFYKKDKLLSEAKQRLDNFTKTNNFIDKSPLQKNEMILDYDKNQEKILDIENEFKKSEVERDAIEKRGLKIAENVETILNDLKALESGK